WTQNYIIREIGTAQFDLYKNSVYPKNLMDRKDTFLNYFDTIDDSNLTVVVHPTTPKLPLANS
ncbi:18625_t:CDS:1, partial [Funneliformis geosporum]